MKPLYYYSEKTKYLNSALLVLSIALLLNTLVFTNHEVDKAYVGVLIMLIIISLYKGFEGFVLLYKKKTCKSKGTEYEGRIVGKIGHSTNKEGYFYKLAILFKNGKIITPYIQAKYIDKLKSRLCTVNVYRNMIYVDGFVLCNKDEKPIEIRIIHN